jgi:hypothetical protein
LKSTGLPNIGEDDWDAQAYTYVRPACIKFKACKQNLSDRDDLLRQFNIDLTEEEIEILVHFMLIEYLSAMYINVPSLLHQSLTSKDFHVFSSRNHLDGLVNLRSIYGREVRQMVSIYSNQDSDLFNRLRIKRGVSETED